MPPVCFRSSFSHRFTCYGALPNRVYSRNLAAVRIDGVGCNRSHCSLGALWKSSAPELKSRISGPSVCKVFFYNYNILINIANVWSITQFCVDPTGWSRRADVWDRMRIVIKRAVIARNGGLDQHVSLMAHFLYGPLFERSAELRFPRPSDQPFSTVCVAKRRLPTSTACA